MNTARASNLNRHDHVHAHIAAAVEALYVADQLLQDAAANVVRRGVWSPDANDFLEMAVQARVWARLLAETTTTPPSLSRRDFESIANRTNRNALNSPHLEASFLAVSLAYRCLDEALSAGCLDEALTAACQVSDDEANDTFEAAYAARASLRMVASCLESVVVPFDTKKSLNAIIAGAQPSRSRTATSVRQRIVA